MRRDSPAARIRPGDAHFASTARTCPPANTDMESERQLDAALRRTAIISAATEMAISSGRNGADIQPHGRVDALERRARHAFLFQFADHVEHLALAADHGDVARRRGDGQLAARAYRRDGRG